MSRKKWSRKDIRELAESRSLKCKSIKFMDKRPRIVLECPYGHEFEEKLGLVKNGNWCPECVTKPEFVPKELIVLFNGFTLEKYAKSKVVVSYWRMTTKKLVESLVEFVETSNPK